MNQFKKLLLLPIVLFIYSFSIAQSTNTPIPELDSLRQLYRSDKIDDTTFMNLVVKSVKYNNYSNAVFKEFIEYYREVAFSKKKYGKYRAQYYKFLSNISLYNSNDGARVFYAEKIDEELRKLPDYIPSLSSTMIEVNWFANWKMAKKGLDKAKPLFGFLDSLPRLIQSKVVPYSTVHNGLHLLKYIEILYLVEKDTLNANKQLVLAKKIYEAAVKRNIYTGDNIGIFYFVVLYMRYQMDYYLENTVAMEKDLRLILQHAGEGRAKGYVWAGTEFTNTHLSLVDLFIQENKLDSAVKYLAIYKNENLQTDKTWGADEDYFKQQSHLESAKGNYKAAIEYLQKAYALKDSIIDVRMSDITNNMYAQTQAEFNKNELTKAEQEKRKRNQLIIIITVTLLSGILLLVRLMIKKDKRAKQNIEKLATAGQLQIAELEERSRITQQEEQQRLGMELHDDLAGSIVNVKINMEQQIAAITDPQVKGRLEELNKLIADAYQRTRGKSHELYSLANYNPELSFAKRIETLIGNGLPDKTYRKEVSIEKDALQNVPLSVLIEFLHIIQEAVTNILKHAKASAVDIFIYREESQLILKVNDNGKGFDTTSRKKGIGLSSIEKRVKKMNGRLQIDAGKDGTALTIFIPSGEEV